MDVARDAGLWHCITGYLPPSTSPLAQAIQELHEETGLTAAYIEDVRIGPVLNLPGDDEIPWEVHTFAAHTTIRKLTLNWEHDAYRWVKARHIRGFTQVHWLSTVLRALEPRVDVDTGSTPSGAASGRAGRWSGPQRRRHERHTAKGRAGAPATQVEPPCDQDTTR
jgi:hypothetical protein